MSAGLGLAQRRQDAKDKLGLLVPFGAPLIEDGIAPSSTASTADASRWVAGFTPARSVRSTTLGRRPGGVGASRRTRRR
jgi:hypothetical protein